LFYKTSIFYLNNNVIILKKKELMVISSVDITGKTLSIEEVVAVAYNKATVNPLNDETKKRMEASNEWLHNAIFNDKELFYGINTGFGSHANQAIDPEKASQLSRNVILADVTGVGDPLPAEIVRAMMLIRANTMATGHSAIRPVVVEQLIAMLNKNVVPYVPSKGSLGASGDLVPLASIAIVATRDANEGGYSGKAWFEGELMTGEAAMQKAEIPRLQLIFKEGLSMINGTTMMTAFGCLAIDKCEKLIKHAEIASALSLEALTAVSAAFHPDIHAASQQIGQVKTADNMRRLFHGSQLIDSSDRIQDAYSARCIPQVVGPIRDTVGFVRPYIERTLNASIDNPLIFKSEDQQSYNSYSGGSFHGEGLALMVDYLSIAMSEIANVSDRRAFSLLTPELNNGLPSMLIRGNGLNTGLMVAQYVGAALVSDNKTLAHPDSVDSIPSSANQEDHVSMGANGARHLWEILENVTNVVAIELLCAAQGIDLRENGSEKLGVGTGAAYLIVRTKVKKYDNDHEMSPDINNLVKLMQSNAIIDAVEKEIEHL